MPDGCFRWQTNRMYGDGTLWNQSARKSPPKRPSMGWDWDQQIPLPKCNFFFIALGNNERVFDVRSLIYFSAISPQLAVDLAPINIINIVGSLFPAFFCIH